MIRDRPRGSDPTEQIKAEIQVGGLIRTLKQVCLPLP